MKIEHPTGTLTPTDVLHRLHSLGAQLQAHGVQLTWDLDGRGAYFEGTVSGVDLSGTLTIQPGRVVIEGEANAGVLTRALATAYLKRALASALS